MTDTEIISQNVRIIRKKVMKQSQIEFAANCGISPEILSMLECGKTDPKLSTLESITAYLGITLAELLTYHLRQKENENELHLQHA